MKKKSTIIILVVVILLVFYFVFKQFFGNKAATPTVVSGRDAQGVAQATGDTSPLNDLLVLIQSINTVSLNGTIFTRPDFKYLRNLSSTNIPSASVLGGGRYNPFLPYDPVSNGTLPQGVSTAPTSNKPTVSITTNIPTSVKGTDAILGAKVSDPKIAQIYFEYGTSATQLDKKTITISTKDDGTGSLQITGLTPNTTYFVRATLNGAEGPVAGSTVTFKTLAQ